MKMRILAFFLTLCLIFSMTPVDVFAVNFDGQDGFGVGEEISIAANEEDNSDSSEGLRATTVPVVTVTNEKTGKIRLTWKAVAGAVSYKVYRSTEKDGKYSRMFTTEGTSYTNSNCEVGETYYYKVTALDANGKTISTSKVVKGTRILPQPVASAAVVEKTGKIRLTWKAVEGAVQYRVFRATKIDGEYTRMFTTDALSYTNSNAEAGKTYYYKVVALGNVSAATSADSEIVSATAVLAKPVVTVTNVENTGKIRLTWEPVAGAVKYRVFRATEVNGEYTRMFTTDALSYTNSNAEAGKTYYYKVVALGNVSAAASAFSDVVSRTGVLAQPVVTVTNDQDTGKIRLTWEPVAGAVKYRVFRATEIDGEYTRMFTTEGTSYTNSSCEPGVTYYYKVIALADVSAANSEFSAVVTGMYTLGEPVVTVTNVEKTGKIKLTWERVEGAAGYSIYRADEIDGEYIRMFTTASTSYTNSKAEAGKTYYYKVVALNANGRMISDYSETIAATCMLPQPEAAVSIVEKTGKIRLTWEKLEGAAKYRVYRASEADGEYARVFTTDGTSYTNSKAVAGMTYYYKVVALDENGKILSAFSEVVSGTCSMAQPVVTVSNVEKTGKVKLTWEAVEGAVKYQIFRATEVNGEYTRMFTTSATSYTNSKADLGVTYYYKVCALNAAEIAVFSEPVAGASNLAQTAFTVTNVESNGRIKLDWETVEGAVAYKIYRSESENGQYKLMYTSYSNTYTNVNAVFGKTYFYKIVAVAENTDANSAFSVVKQGTVTCGQPTITGVADGKTGKPRVTWESVEGAVEYKVYRSTSLDGKYSLMYTSTSNTYQNTKAEVGKTYYYKIQAVGENPDTASAYSNVVSIMAVNNNYQYVFSSYTTTKSGTAERNTNLYLSCKAINGTILAPGDTFSFNEIVGPRTANKGYQAAPIVGGMGRGGGICQVSTTLFNVALYGNMEIAQRRQHSVAVTYVPLGRDAMIYKTASDFKFVNNSPYYIKVVASASGGTVKISLMTREPNVSPKSDVDLRVTYASGVYTLKRYYKGEVNYSCKSKYK